MNLKNKRAHMFAALVIGFWILLVAIMVGAAHLIMFLLNNYGEDVVGFFIIGAVTVFLYWFMYFLEYKS